MRLNEALFGGLQLTPPVEPKTPLEATLDGMPVLITAILERTAVYHRGDERDKQLVRLDRLDVDASLAADLTRWRPVQPDLEGPRARGRALARITRTRHLHQQSAAAEERLARRKQLALHGLDWCRVGDHEVNLDQVNGNGVCKSCTAASDRAKRAAKAAAVVAA